LFAKHQTSRPWGTGDNVNLAIGQGDLQTNPLQLAIAYAALANGGSIVTPHVGLSVDDGPRTLQGIAPPPKRKVDISPQNRDVILAGLRAAAGESGGTSSSVFGGFPVPVAGKTGTAQVGAGVMDQSWYAALAPYPNPRYVVVVTIEHGGLGEKAAAPAARNIIASLFQPPPPPAPGPGA
jgi:penicillin-binding protein 2